MSPEAPRPAATPGLSGAPPVENGDSAAHLFDRRAASLRDNERENAREAVGRRTPAIKHCLRRAAEAERLAALADDYGSKFRYGQLARAWRRLARNAEFTSRLNALLSGAASPAWNWYP